MAKHLVHRPAATMWAVLADEDSGSEPSSPVAAAVTAATLKVSVALTAAAQKKPSAARRVSFAPLPEPRHAREVDRAISPVRLVPVRGSAGPTAADMGAPLENVWVHLDVEEVMAAMERGDALWGDLMFPPGCVMPVASVVESVAARRANTAADFWDQPWAEKVEEVGCGDIYDTSRCSDEEWEAMMGWLFQSGWYIRDWCREFVYADPDDAPPRTWIPPSVLEADAAMTRRGYSRSVGKPAAAACCGGHAPVAAPAPKKEKVAKPVVVIPRFCRAAGACTDEGCRYTHGDTIPVQNKPCAFDGRCCGEKRATCVYLHPSEGEVWTADLVRHRPAVATTD
jgi:hypothetical protein